MAEGMMYAEVQRPGYAWHFGGGQGFVRHPEKDKVSKASHRPCPLGHHRFLF